MELSLTWPGLDTGRRRSTMIVNQFPVAGVGMCHWKASENIGWEVSE